MLIYQPQDALARWAGEHLGIADWGHCSAIGVLRHEKLVAVAVFHQYRWPDIEISFVTTDARWATRQNVSGILRYPFIQLGCRRLTALTKATNQRARAFLCRLGFKQEGYHPDVFANGDAVSYGLLRKDASRWIAEEAHVETPSSDTA